MNFGKKMAVGVASVALTAGMGVVPTFAAGSEAPKPSDGDRNRIASGKPANDRIDTAIEVVSAAYANKALAQAAYLVNPEAMVDAATAGQLADGPIFLVSDNSCVIDQVKGEVAKYTSAKMVYAIGGTGVIFDDILKAVVDDKTMARLSGADCHATAVEVAKRIIVVTPESVRNVYVAREDNPIDALTVGILDNSPVIYAKGGELPEASKAYAESVKSEKVIGLDRKGAVPGSALTTAQVSGSPIEVNPAEKSDEHKAAWKQFDEIRWLYLGYNAYKDKLPVEATSVVGTSTDPKTTPIKHPEWLGESTDMSWSHAAGNPDARSQGYKKQLSELAKRKPDVVDSYTSTLEADAQQDVNNPTSGRGGKITQVELKTEIKGTGVTALKKAAKEIYGVVPEGDDDKQTDFHVMAPDKDAPGEKDRAMVTGVAQGKLADDSAYKNAANAAGDVVKEFHKDPSNTKVLSEDVNTAVASIRNVATKALSDLIASNSVRFGVVQSVLDRFASIAQPNADTTRGRMLSALKKLCGGKEFFRLAGKDRYETAVAISQYRRVVFGGLNRNDISEGGNLSKVCLTNGVTMVDAPVAGVLTRGPILLTNKEGNLPGAIVKELKTIDASETTVKGEMPLAMLTGGKSAIPDKTGIKAAATIKEGNDTKPEKKTASKSKLTNTGDTDVMVEHGKNSATGSFLYDDKAVNNDKLTVGQAKGATGATAPTVAKNNGMVTVNATSTTPGKYTVEVKYADGDKKGDYTVNITVTKATSTPLSDLVVTVDKNTASSAASSDDVRVKFKKVDSGVAMITASDMMGVTVEGTVNDGKLTKLSNDGKFDDADSGKAKAEYEVATGKLKLTGASGETKIHAQKIVTFRLKLILSAGMSKNYADAVDVPVKVTTGNF